MTFTEIQTEICDRLNLTDSDDIARVGRAINRKYKTITSSLGIKGTSRRATVSAIASIGGSELTFTGIEKIINVIDRTDGNRRLDEVTVEELLEQ